MAPITENEYYEQLNQAGIDYEIRVRVFDIKNKISHNINYVVKKRSQLKQFDLLMGLESVFHKIKKSLKKAGLL